MTQHGVILISNNTTSSCISGLQLNRIDDFSIWVHQ